MNDFRSREELLVATAERVVSLYPADAGRTDRAVDVGGASDPLTELLAASLVDAATVSHDRYLAIFELQLEARRRPAPAAALAHLEPVAAASTADGHAALGLRVPPEAVGSLTTLCGGALFVLVAGPGAVPPDAVRQFARAVVHGALGAHPGGARGRAGPR
ncbi:transcriptional regulator, TetR family [Geodermatophilus dictyosporus]|uniref:Transcriptional regulator, TetR family n=1 Tax=Geodermatophilus dictyosporus TaxID=1523247 RepID=A0A1I5JTY1_9ACTN|nr:ABC-F family ATP-binding cassette domain-containing protein [Geodermatophilus dictyosporus]SFO76282.1 transcriptional regulator, TetR family [Geodermatophilus dictyosporus]